MKILVNIETSWVGASEEVEVELDDDATEEEIEAAAHEEFLNYCNYGWSIVKEGDEKND